MNESRVTNAPALKSASNGVSGNVNQPTAHLERFDPRDGTGRLIDSEHRGRYWWAAQTVYGKEVLDAGCGVGYGLEILAQAGASAVTGIDVDEGTVKQARERYGDSAEEIATGDLRELPFADESFDLVVCFETIHHVSDGERALGELHRVLRPGGLLLISSPSPDVFLQGNKHHVHEYRPTELSAVIEERFTNVARYRQHPWLASAIEPAPNGSDLTAPRRRQTYATSELDPGAETYSLLAASDAELPELGELVTLGDDFEVRWWAERVAAAERQVDEAQADAECRAREEIAAVQSQASEEVAAAESQARERIAEVEEDHRQARERIEAAEREARARAEEAEEAEKLLAATENELRRLLTAAEAREQAAAERLLETNKALLEANQSLAKLPALQHRFDELEGLRAYVEMLEGSKSWRYMAPLRWLWRVLRLRRGGP